MARNPLIRKIPNTSKSHNMQHKSAGILDDYAVRKSVEVQGDINAGGSISGKKVGVYAYIDTPVLTELTLANTYYAIAGDFTNDPIEDFTGATVTVPGIKYVGVYKQYFEIDFHASVATDKAETLTTAIYKNGVLFPGSQMSTFCKVANEFYNISGTCVLELEENDEIQLVVKGTSVDSYADFNYYATTITEFFD